MIGGKLIVFLPARTFPSFDDENGHAEAVLLDWIVCPESSNPRWEKRTSSMFYSISIREEPVARGLQTHKVVEGRGE